MDGYQKFNKGSGKRQEFKKPFVNPYNFIPFEDTIGTKRISREEAYKNKGELLSGWLNVELQTKTPLIIMDGAHPKYLDIEKKKYINEKMAEKSENVHKEYDCFRLPNEEGKKTAIIPGSELRGMIRSIYEAETDSCVPFLLDEKPISRRVPVYGALRQRGLLTYDKEKNQWSLFKGITNKREEAKIRYDKYKHRVLADEKPIRYKNGEYVDKVGWVQYNVPVNPENYHIAYLKQGDIVKRWKIGDDEPYKKLKSALERDGAGAGASMNEIPNKNLQKALENAKDGKNNMVPVYYIKVERGTETLVYLSNSAIGRIAQKRKWVDIMGEYAPCEDTDALCPACLLFGTTKGKGMKSRIQVTDAVPENPEDLKFEKHTLPILATPRTSAFEFYLEKPTEKATFWNFDFYGESRDVYTKSGRRETQIKYYDLKKATPRGRKMYWHSKPVKDDIQKGKMNCTAEAVNGTFDFKIYFDEITKQQLEELIWVITLGDNRKTSSRQHKLGHARPLGYGSVKLQVTGQTIRRLIYVKESESLKIEIEHKNQEEIQIPARLHKGSKAEENLLIMTSTTSLPKNVPVMYPREKRRQEDNIYTWFAKNRSNARNVKTLPYPTDEEKTLGGNWNDNSQKEKYSEKFGTGSYKKSFNGKRKS